jgi:aerobic carbon-monoxide dehydrogenase small subunit
MKIEIHTVLNGRELQTLVKPNQTLLEFLRDDLHLKGSMEGCGVGVCGSCRVLVEGRPVSSCLMLATNVEDKEVMTIEGLAPVTNLIGCSRRFSTIMPFNAATALRE